MTEQVSDAKTYELAYHLIPDLEEAGVKAHAQELNDLITQNGGSLLTSREPRKIHLSYPVKNKNYAYFGLMDFSAIPDTIEKLNAQMKLQNGILRYLLLTKPIHKELRVLGVYRPRPRTIKTHDQTVMADATKKPAKEKTKEETEQLEKDIEKVIENL